jgi:hypothetical protein
MSIANVEAKWSDGELIFYSVETGNNIAKFDPTNDRFDILQNLALSGTDISATAAELNILDGATVTAAELNNAADVSARVQELTETGDVTAGVQSVELNHNSTIIEATIADATNHEGIFIVKNTSASGTAAHTLTLTSGTFDGTNNVATLNAPDEALIVYFDSAGNGTIVENVDSVGLA